MENCGACKHAKDVKAKGTGTVLGFIRCDKGKQYEWWPPRHRCQRYERRTDQPEGAKEGASDGGRYREATAVLWPEGVEG